MGTHTLASAKASEFNLPLPQPEAVETGATGAGSEDEQTARAEDFARLDGAMDWSVLLDTPRLTCGKIGAPDAIVDTALLLDRPGQRSDFPWTAIDGFL
jgi:hypothetical protein